MTYLIHSGIKGMHWGVRRWQNEDGTLTPAGKERYGSVENFERSRAERKAKIKKGLAIAGGAALAVGAGIAAKKMYDNSYHQKLKRAEAFDNRPSNASRMGYKIEGGDFGHLHADNARGMQELINAGVQKRFQSLMSNPATSIFALREDNSRKAAENRRKMEAGRKFSLSAGFSRGVTGSSIMNTNIKEAVANTDIAALARTLGITTLPKGHK